MTYTKQTPNLHRKTTSEYLYAGITTVTQTQKKPREMGVTCTTKKLAVKERRNVFLPVLSRNNTASPTVEPSLQQTFIVSHLSNQIEGRGDTHNLALSYHALLQRHKKPEALVKHHKCRDQCHLSLEQGKARQTKDKTLVIHTTKKKKNIRSPSTLSKLSRVCGCA